jgi:hypothetical protein
VAYQHDTPVSAQGDVATNLGKVEFPSGLNGTHFIKLELHDAQGKQLSSNFYWRAQTGYPDVLTDLDKLPMVTLEATVERKDENGKRLLIVTLHNPAPSLAVMTHLQLRREHSKERVLPAYYSDNYISLVPKEMRMITIEADENAFNNEDALVMVDGWNVSVAPASFSGAAIAPNLDAQPSHSPETGLPFQTTNLR